MDLLAGDIGGTKTLLLRGRWQAGRLETLAEARFDSNAYPDLADIVHEFLAGAPPPESACFAVAGPVQPAPGGGAQARITNLPWLLDSDRLGRVLGIGRVTLINDLAAVGHGIGMLSATDILTVQAGQPQADGLRAVMGIGTGLGMALVLPGRETAQVFPSEGGHVDFAPLDEQQVRLREFARQRLGIDRVSFERLAAGPGLALIHAFLGGADLDTPSIAAAAAAGDAIAREALQLFARLCGAVAGNLALTCLPFGGFYLTGGVVQKNQPLFSSPAFVDAFHAKGRMAGLLRRMPLHVIGEPRVGLLGAAAHAARHGDRE
ncbi:glucokinase [Immundisolibacter sp.]|uniref:glucokinase n=1 Tax=Immundisolibacter sp. TaxID=1934948 RepID=UPI0019BED09E|nr:glucokinase [Immundisolibacter sp.]MBC7162841.1 glucokinase [Immundisolibacter sp.]MEA3219961.1 Glucokinase [Immundisolibacter sp.]